MGQAPYRYCLRVASISEVSRYRSNGSGSWGSKGWKPSRSHQARAAAFSAVTTTVRQAAFSFSSTAVAGTYTAYAVTMPRFVYRRLTASQTSRRAVTGSGAALATISGAENQTMPVIA